MKPFKTIKPIGDQILVEQIDPDEMTKGGIYIPEAYRDKTLRAKVLAIGSGKLNKKRQRIPAPIKVGDEIIIGMAAAQDAPIKLNGKQYSMIMEGDIVAVVE